jgi:hypothetical protein
VNLKVNLLKTIDNLKMTWFFTRGTYDNFTGGGGGGEAGGTVKRFIPKSVFHKPYKNFFLITE